MYSTLFCMYQMGKGKAQNEDMKIQTPMKGPFFTCYCPIVFDAEEQTETAQCLFFAFLPQKRPKNMKGKELLGFSLRLPLVWPSNSNKEGFPIFGHSVLSEVGVPKWKWKWRGHRQCHWGWYSRPKRS